ncbi:ATP-binding cassette domain-containing protein [Clostridium senegalense]|uniref:ATP-binding cassette domain-containing protein n=1 Tax=Clostridium senegalense TaxID=1465809 RepID=UPI00028A4049|nr:ATP-binding cassette domain-containing protein [Clostridium senegalense]
MKRAILIEDRIEENLNAKKELLKDYERERKLKFESSIKGENILLISNITVLRGSKIVINNLSFNIKKGERVGIKGPNGSGKTTLLYAILGILELEEGIIKIENRSKIVYASQFPKWTNGFLREHLKSEKIDETRFRSILGCMGSDSKVFERDLSTFSVGELKKVDLAYCFYKDDCFQIWDEPLNGLDIESRKLIEKAILEFKPTILFVEHDKSFIENISTKIIDLNINY